MLIDVSKRTISTTVLGKPVAFPLGVSPSAMQKLAHPEGECANVRSNKATVNRCFKSNPMTMVYLPCDNIILGAASMGTIYILSTISTTSLEEVAAAAPNARRWYQLYVYKDR